MKKYIIFSLLIIGSLSVSCEEWFDVTGSSEIREKDHYSTERGFQQTLIGCYIGMTDTHLYGRNLSWLLIERLARQYNPVPSTSQTSLCYNLELFDYTYPAVKTELERIWAQGFNVIVNANEALNYIDRNRNVLNTTAYKIIKGELLAVRAYMHFDLLRLYGYGDREKRKEEIDSKMTLPYVTGVDKKAAPQVTGADFIKNLLADLTEAAALLKAEDPVTGVHEETYYEEIDENGFYKTRNLRLNYFAVRGLMARIYMWEGSSASKKLALEAAEEVIRDAFEKNFVQWMTADDTRRILGMGYEQLFALNVSDVEKTYTGFFNPAYADTDDNAIFIRSDVAESDIYENIVSDFRFSSLTIQNNISTSAGRVPLKIYQTAEADSRYKNVIPLMRIPEMYYIAAECYVTGPEPDKGKALELLNTVREHRGIYTALENLSDEEVIDEIDKEYRKEFLCEGVMFYHCKRVGALYLPKLDQEMTDKQYVIPFPDFEKDMGRIQ